MGDISRPELITHQPDVPGVWTDEDQPMLLAGVSKLRLFREKPVARVNGIRPSPKSGGDDGPNTQIAFRGRCRTDAYNAVGHLGRQTFQVRLRRRQDRLNSQIPAGANDPNGYFPPVGHQHGAERFSGGGHAQSPEPGTGAAAMAFFAASVSPGMALNSPTGRLGRMPMYFPMMVSMISSAPPAMDISRASR